MAPSSTSKGAAVSEVLVCTMESTAAVSRSIVTGGGGDGDDGGGTYVMGTMPPWLSLQPASSVPAMVAPPINKAILAFMGRPQKFGEPATGVLRYGNAVRKLAGLACTPSVYLSWRDASEEGSGSLAL